MEAHFIFEQVQRMRPSSFSEEERYRYQAEKMMLRQFVLMKQQDRLPDHLSVRDMKTWLLTGRSFLEEFQEIIEREGIDHLFMAELAWTTARHFCLSQMEQELLEELDREKRLSQLLSRKVTLEGLQMFVSIVHPAAEEDVQTFLPSLHSKLLQTFGGIHITSSMLSAGDAKPAELLELEQSTAPLVPEVVDTALKFLLEEPEQKNKSEAASAEIGKLLTNSAAPCLSQFGSVSKTLLLSVCTVEARSMVKAVYERFDKCSKSFHQMDYDESYYTATEGVISAIQDMDHDVQIATRKAHLQLEEGLLEKREASLEVTSLNELERGLLEKREASLEVTSLDELEKGLLEKREAFPIVSLEEMVTTVSLADETEDASSVKLETNVIAHLDDELEVLQLEEVKDSKKEASLVQDSAIQDLDHKVQTAASNQGRGELSASEEQEDPLLEKREACPGVSVDDEVATMHNVTTKDTWLFRLETNVIVDMDDELEEVQQDCDVKKKKKKKKKKKEVRAFFRGFWKMMTCCFCISTED